MNESGKIRGNNTRNMSTFVRVCRSTFRARRAVVGTLIHATAAFD
jgi:hypothetical protein